MPVHAPDALLDQQIPAQLNIQSRDQKGFSVTDCRPRIMADGATYRPLTPEDHAQFECVEVFYGTNRLSDEDIDGETVDGRLIDQTAYESAPDPQCEPHALGDNPVCELGRIFVSMPANREPGDCIPALQDSAIDPGPIDLATKFTIWAYQPFDSERSFQLAVQQALSSEAALGDQALVYIHGFNETFRQAAFRAAQLKHDIDFNGPVFFYSWPANNSISEYLTDMDDADLSVPAVADFLVSVREAVGEETPINVVAHSMGSRVFAQALNHARLSDRPIELNHVFIPSGDLDTNLFDQWYAPNGPNIRTLTLYTSQTDNAVSFATLLRTPRQHWWSPIVEFLEGSGESDIPPENKFRIGYFRSGEAPVLFNFPVGRETSGFPLGQPQTIDTSLDPVGFWGRLWLDLNGEARGHAHADYASNGRTIADIRQRLLSDEPNTPADRDPEAFSFIGTEAEGRGYWRFNRPDDDRRFCTE